MPDDKQVNIFGEKQQYKQTNFTTSENMVLKVGSNETDDEYLVQGVSIQSASPGQPLFEIGSTNCYMAPAGRSMGSMQIEKIVGKKTIVAVLGQEGQGVWTTDDGNTSDRTISLYSVDENGGASLKYKCTGCKVEQYATNVSAQGKLISETASIKFLNLYFKK
jgi:hypothetical protein